MDYKRKKRWVRYHHLKCKMYLRNDFCFECAYCRMREQDTGTLYEDYFEKDHFIAKTSDADIDLDSYDNMVYACSKCNGTKSNKSVDLLLDPCRDNIYSGANPHVKNLGMDGQYQLIGNTSKGWQYINSLQLNSKFYREMRERQERADKDNYELNGLINEISDYPGIPSDLLQKLKLVCTNYLIQMNNPQDSDFKCGRSKAGEAFKEVLDILNTLSISHELIFAENDLDVRIRYNDTEYLCEIVLNDKAEKPVRNIRMKKEQRESWADIDGKYGVLYYYLKTGRLELYDIDEENKLLVCLKE